MSNYKSKHTGAQVDEAVSKVLNGEVGGSGGATPDWNAQEGEAGYIENRTHGIIWYYKPEDVNFNELLLGLKNKTPEIIIEDSFTKATYKQVNNLEPMANCNVKFFESTGAYSYNYLDRFTDTFLTYDGTKGSIYADYDDNADVYITIQWDNSTGIEDVNAILNGINQDYYVIDSSNYEILALDSAYLPDTLLKTTPQTLSDDNKNQALANLGIDPIVWKYICNPYIFNCEDFNSGYSIPSELMENGKLKYKIPAMYRINVSDDYVNPDSGESIDFSDINNLYGEYTPVYVDNNMLYTTYLANGFIVRVDITSTGEWSITTTV